VSSVPLPVELSVVNVTGTYIDFNGVPVAGVVRFEARVPVLLAPDSEVVLVPVIKEAVLDGAGHFELQLPSTSDPDVNPHTGWGYRVEERWPEGRIFYMLVPADQGPVDISQYSPITDYTELALGPRGIQGPPGDLGPSAQSGYFSPPTIDNDVTSVRIVSGWGVRANGTAYYDPLGADEGEAAILGWNARGVLVLRKAGALEDPTYLPKVYHAVSLAAQLALPAVQGDFCMRDDEGQSYILERAPASLYGNWSAIGASSVSAFDAPSSQVGDVQVTVGVPSLSVDITSNWGLTDTGIYYYDDQGAAATEAALLVPDPDGNGFSLFRPGGPWVSEDQRVAGLATQSAAPGVPASQVRQVLEGLRRTTPRNVSQNYTLALSDVGQFLFNNSVTPFTYIVPADTAAAFAVGDWVDVAQWSTGAVTVQADSGVLIVANGVSSNANFVLPARYSAFRLMKAGANTWLVYNLTGIPALPYAQLRQIVAQTGLTTNAWVDLSFTTEDYDSHNGHDNAIVNTRWTCPVGQAGVFAVQGIASFANPAALSVFAVRLAKNGAEVAPGQTHTKLDTGPQLITPRMFVTLAAGDYVTTQATASQTSWATSVGGVNNTGVGSGMTVERVR
jgi:hypothetical protein